MGVDVSSAALQVKVFVWAVRRGFFSAYAMRTYSPLGGTPSCVEKER
jgi:hypothetical protein